MSRALIALILLVVAAGFAAARHDGYLRDFRTAPAVVVTQPPVRVTTDTLHARETLSDVFARQGVTDVDWTAIRRAVDAFDPARLRAGLVFTFQQRHGEEEPHAVAVRTSWDTQVYLRRAGDGRWAASLERVPWTAETFVIEGTVASSVSDAITASMGDNVLPLESRAALVWSLADVYDWVVDFSRDVQEGDHFRVLAEKLVSPDGETRFERILAARLDIGPRPLYAFRFDDPAGRQEFYDETDRSLRRDLLRAPLEYRRISSGFSHRRYHPILHVMRAHQGIDFAAAYGAPVRSVGDGIVTFAGRMGGYGNMIEVRHTESRTSRYAHLSEIEPEVTVGARVEQGQTIGKVGASGLATAPHLHYELRINGIAVNPRRQFAVGEGQLIAAARRTAYEEEMRRLRSQLESPPPVLAAGTGSVD